jgi:hypothetical protein
MAFVSPLGASYLLDDLVPVAFLLHLFSPYLLLSQPSMSATFYSSGSGLERDRPDSPSPILLARPKPPSSSLDPLLRLVFVGAAYMIVFLPIIA